MPNSDVQRANPGPYDRKIYPPKWAFEPITDEEYEKQKAEWLAKELAAEAKEGNDGCQFLATLVPFPAPWLNLMAK